MNKTLSQKIILLGQKDQKEARRGLESGQFDDEIFKKNAALFKKIVAKHGWPSVNMVGKKASRYAWLLIQHADHDLKFQKKCLRLMQNVYAENNKNVDRANIAYLIDRVLVNERKKQLFGTQCYFRRDGVFAVRPVRNTRTIEQRRRDYGLEPFKEFLVVVKKYPPPHPTEQRKKAKL